MTYDTFDQSASSKFVMLCYEIRRDYPLDSHEGLDAPTILPAGSMEAVGEYPEGDTLVAPTVTYRGR